MPDTYKLTERDIKSRTTSKVFARGQDYYRDNAISQMVKRGDSIEGLCQGSYPEPYRVTVSINDSGILHTNCTCEYDWGGDCKHIVALLLTYSHKPQLFVERPPLEQSLEAREKSDLIDIIMTMLTRYPDLQEIVDHPTVNEVVEGRASFDILSIRQKLHQSFQNPVYDPWNHHGAMPEDTVYEVVEMAKRFSEKDDWFTATQLYRVILEEFGELDFDYYYDEDGEFAYAIQQVTQATDACFQKSEIVDVELERKSLIQALLNVYIWDINFGGIDVGAFADEIILKHMRSDDIKMVRQQLEKQRDNALKREYSQFGAEAYERFLIELDALDDVDPDIVLKRLEAQGLYHLMLKKLLDLERIDDATTLIKNKVQNSYDFVKALYELSQHRHSALAIKIAEARANTFHDRQIIDWLIFQYDKQKELARALYWRRVLLKDEPSVRGYNRRCAVMYC